MTWNPLNRVRADDDRPTEPNVTLIVARLQADEAFNDLSATRLRDTARRLLEARRAVHTGRLNEWGRRP